MPNLHSFEPAEDRGRRHVDELVMEPAPHAAARAR